MTRQLFKAVHYISAVFFCGLAFALFYGAEQAAAAPLSLSPFEDRLIPAMAVFMLLALLLIVWMLWDRKRLKNHLRAVEKEQHLESLLLQSREDVSMVWDEQGRVLSFDQVRKWFGLKQGDNDLSLLRNPEKALTDEQFDQFREAVDRLNAYGESFRELFCLVPQKRNIIIKGEALRDGNHLKGSIVWFRDATIEENIAVFQEQNVRKINTRLAFYDSICNLVHIPMWMRNADLDLSWVNAAYVAAVDGDSAQQVVADSLELVTSSIGKTTRDIAAISRDTRECYSEKHFVVMQGERRAVDIHNIPFQMSGHPAGYLGYAQDITELEKAKGELIHHTESHSETLNKLSTAVAIFTAGKRLEYYNSAFSRLWQIPEGLLFSHPHHGEVLEAMREARRLPEQANFPEWKAGQLAAYTALLEPVEEMWHLPDNTSLRVVTQPHPLGGLLIFYEDVTDHFALERSYNTLFAVQRETLNNLHEGVAVFGIDGCLQLYNQAFVEMWRLDLALLDGNPHTMEVMDACAENYGGSEEITELIKLIVGGEGKKEVAFGQLKRRDDSVLDYSAVPLPDGAMLITFIDVSDSFVKEKALRERNEALEETDKIKTDFLAHMSYELRNPLNSIIGFAELLEKEYHGPLNDIQQEYTLNILSASGHLLELINDILDLAVIEAGGMTLDVEQFNLSDVADMVLDQLEDRIKVKNIELTVDCATSLTPVRGDIKRIQHTVYNLLSNAVKFTPALGTVTLTIRQDDLNYQIIVQDSGVGVAPEEIDKIFEKFFTGSNVPHGQGAGLGLSLVRSFVELHGGRVEVSSNLNMGTTFTLTLPMRLGMEAQISLVGE